MTELERYQRLKKQAADLQRSNDQAVGAAEQIRLELKRDEGVEDDDAARKLLKKLKREEQETADLVRESLEKLEEAWPKN